MLPQYSKAGIQKIILSAKLNIIYVQIWNAVYWSSNEFIHKYQKEKSATYFVFFDTEPPHAVTFWEIADKLLYNSYTTESTTFILSKKILRPSGPIERKYIVWGGFGPKGHKNTYSGPEALGISFKFTVSGLMGLAAGTNIHGGKGLYQHAPVTIWKVAQWLAVWTSCF